MWSEIPNSVFRDNIEGNRLIEAPLQIRRVINTPEFQRLRNIKQTGLTSFVFPTAEHSRFSHSVGVYATACQAFRQLHRRAVALHLQTPMSFDDHSQLDFGIAALCHDIGHTAFSHVLENTLLPDGLRSHEECTLAILQDDRAIGKVIKDEADLEAVRNLIAKQHPNKALTTLISSAFDVDRCDYILRDSRMAGVEYGKYDLKWLLHAMTVETNELGQPVLLLDGPRGLDGLRQFLSARRYLYRQVYFHSTIRGAQLLLKAIFDRMQDFGSSEAATTLTPKSLRAIINGKKLSLDDSIRTTDVEILFMVRLFAEDHPDPVLKYLAQLFLRREFPKSVLDSAKLNGPVENSYNVSMNTQKSDQLELMESLSPTNVEELIKELQSLVAERLKANSLPEQAAPYLVKYDPARFLSEPPTDLLFSFGGKIIPLEQVDSGTAGFDAKGLLETFTIKRVFVPKELLADAAKYLNEKYKVKIA